MADPEQGETVNNEGETSAEVPDNNNSPVKRGRGRPQGSKKLQVCVTDLNLTDPALADANGGSVPPKRGRGRPRSVGTSSHPDNSVKRGRGRPKGSKKVVSNDGTPRKRGRPKLNKSTEEKSAESCLYGEEKPLYGFMFPRQCSRKAQDSPHDAQAKFHIQK
uniref:Uncharacterized protein n=1 Tax=Acanthochromis polyacanthus TaxID=80966 RepID=A0A3Q1FV78_9TELE